MSIHKFHLETEDSLIVVGCQINHDNFSLALDTGASHTVIDSTALLIAGYEPEDALRKVRLETASGVIDADVFEVQRFSALGIIKEQFQLCAYDFIGSNILTDFDGVLGLDFFKDKDLNISFRRFEIVVD